MAENLDILNAAVSLLIRLYCWRPDSRGGSAGEA